MTPIIVKNVHCAKGYVELSQGDWMGKIMYGVTVYWDENLSKPLWSLEEAENYIKEIS